MRRYNLDTRIRTTARFTDLAGSPVDPTDTVLQVAPPAGDQRTYTVDTGIVREAVGVFFFDVLLDQVGIWTYRWSGEGSVDVSTGDVRVQVDGSIFPAA